MRCCRPHWHSRPFAFGSTPAPGLPSRRRSGFGSRRHSATRPDRPHPVLNSQSVSRARLGQRPNQPSERALMVRGKPQFRNDASPSPSPISLSSASIASMLGSADCSDSGNARVSSKVETPIGLSNPRKEYSASTWLLRWHRISPIVCASLGCLSWSSTTLQLDLTLLHRRVET